MSTTPQPHLTALTAGTGLMTCGFDIEMKDRFAHWTTFDGVTRDNVEDIIADPVALAGRITSSLAKAMKIFWQVSAYKFTCTASTANPDFPGSSSLSSVLFESILPPARACSPVALSAGVDRDPEDAPRYAVSSLYRATYFVKYLYDGEFIGWGTYDGRSPTSTSFLAIESATEGVWSRLNICGYINERVNSSRRTYDYAYVEIGGASFVCEAFVDTTKNNPPSSTVTTTLDAVNMKAEATVVFTLQDGSGTFTNTCLCQIGPTTGFEYFSFVT